MKLDLSNDATKSDLKKVTCEVDKLDINKLSELNADKLKTIPADLSKLSDVVQNCVVILTLFRMAIFGAAHELGRGGLKKVPPP